MSATIPSLPPPHSHSLGKHRCQSSVAGHVVLAGQPSVVEGVHVDHRVRLHHHGGLGLVLDPALAGERQPDLIGHGAAEGALGTAGTKRSVTAAMFCSLSASRGLEGLSGGRARGLGPFQASAVLCGTEGLCGHLGKDCTFGMLNPAQRQSCWRPGAVLSLRGDRDGSDPPATGQLSFLYLVHHEGSSL